jgi:hypothetical protein
MIPPLKHSPGLVCLLALLAAAPASLARPLDVDWKLFGTSSGLADSDLCFYDENSIMTGPESKVRVRTECLPRMAIEDIDPNSSLSKSIIDAAAGKVAHYYVPPIALIENASVEDMEGIAVYEAVADLAGIQPKASVLYEVDCKEHMLRSLQGTIDQHGHMDSSDTAGTWSYASPDSSGMAMQKLVCMPLPQH